MKKDEADAKSVCLIFCFHGSPERCVPAEQPLEEGARRRRGMECLEEAQFLEAAICQLRQGISRLVIPSEAEGSLWQEGKRECEIGGEKRKPCRVAWDVRYHVKQ